MCSTFKYHNIMGRNFDYDVSYDEEFRIIKPKEFENKYKVVGMATGLVKDYPLLYDGMNECGLCCSALAFEGNAVYNQSTFEKMINVPSYKVVFFILSEYKSVKELVKDLPEWNITDEQFSDEFPNSDLHWFIADTETSIVLEQTKDGLKYYTGEVMTNNPPFISQWRECQEESEYIGCDIQYNNHFKSRGMNTIGLNGDYTSMGRFQRLVWLKNKLEETDNDFNDVSQGFHLLASVEQLYGATPVKGRFEYTIYSVVYDMENMNCYLKRYDECILEKVLV